MDRGRVVRGGGGGEHLVYVSTNARDPPLCVGGRGME